MFGFNIAKEAEKTFTRWAMRRVCKFFLKKKLGKFILGEIDLNQLDVQLSAGTIQLSDLALNVDYLNQQLGTGAALVVQEGSIGSLLVTMPWKSGGCRVELDELELVMAPLRNSPPDRSDTSTSNSQDNERTSQDLGKMEHDESTSLTALSSGDVLEGVKTIAKMVKWLLSSFHVKVSRLIVAVDLCNAEEYNNRYCRTLVLRINEAECGTHISEDFSLVKNIREDNFLGLSRLTNFLKFEGAVLEFLHVDAVDTREQGPCNSETTSSGPFSASCQANAMTPVLTSKDSGVSGYLNLSIPWKNGSLDIRKVDAEAYIDPLELRFQPSTIACFIYLWDIVKGNNITSEGEMVFEGAESIYDDAVSRGSSSTLGPSKFSEDLVAENNRSVVGCGSFVEDVLKKRALLSDSHLISDWMGGSQNNGNHIETDFGASMDQFFECFDELRSSHSALGNSGMWNWTCSVFSAITAASNLASGSLQNPPEQQHIQTNFRLSIAQVSLLLSFSDEDPILSCGSTDNDAKPGSWGRYLGAKLNDLLFVTRVCPEAMNFDAKVELVELDDYFDPQDQSICSKSQCHCDSVKCHVDSIQKTKDAVEDALPPFQSSSLTKVGSRSSWSKNCQRIDRNDIVKTNLLKTSGTFQCQVTVNTCTSGHIFVGPTSFTLKLPQCILWVNFSLIDMITVLLERIGAYGMSDRKNASASEVLFSKSASASQGSERKGTGSRASSSSTKESLKGNISLSDTRVILCFPYIKGGDLESYSLSQFIALDISCQSMSKDKKDEAFEPISATSSRKGYLLSNSRSLHVSMGNLHAYLITSETQDVYGSKSCCMLKPKYIAKEIMSIAGGTGRSSVIGMFWQEGAFTGSWIVNKAKHLATAGILRNRDKFMGKDCEFGSLITVKEVGDLESPIKQEIISSSGFFLHAKLLPVVINLEKSPYNSLMCLLHQLEDCLSPVMSDNINKEDVSQGSVLVECDSISVNIFLDVEEAVKGLNDKELPGSWNRFHLKLQKFVFLSASNIGGIRDASFLWVAHREGNLLGSVIGTPSEELLLISCSSSALGRGDGEGSNVLSPMFPGSDVIHLWHPEEFHSYTSVGISCGTVVTRDCRFDWWDSLYSFFCFPSGEVEPTSDKSLPKKDSESSINCGSSFILYLVDVALSYEPFSYGNMASEGSASEPFCATTSGHADESRFAFIVAASSLRLSNINLSNHSVGEYKIRVQELGLLLCPVSKSMNVFGQYSADNLKVVGYRKIAQEPHFEVLLRTVCEAGFVWVVECSDSHIVLNTCYDTAAGLIRLCTQIQELFAPDMEDAMVHLQTRWRNVKRANEDTERGTSDVDASALAVPESQDLDTKSLSCLGNLMDEICEDVFQLNDNCDEQGDYLHAHHGSFNRPLVQSSYPSPRVIENFSARPAFTESSSVHSLGNNATAFRQEKMPQFIEEYFLSDLEPLSGLSLKSQPSEGVLEREFELLDCKKKRGWYGDASLRILENHISEFAEQNNLGQLEGCEAPASYTNPDNNRKIKGRVLFKNMKVVWRMYAGSDWNNLQNTANHHAVTSGRDATVCLEISLSGMKIQYDVFHDDVVPVSRLSLSVQDFGMNDCSKDAPWKLVLGYYQSKDHPRKTYSKALKLDLECVRPDPSTPLEEYRLRIGLLPMRLHLHQTQLDFLINFFGRKSSPVESSLDNTDDMQEPQSSIDHGVIEEALLPYFQKFDIWPVLIRVDYSPRHVDLAALRSGKYVELVNLVPWKGVELQLKHVHAVGVYGWNSICETMIGEWLEDISQNQIHKLLKGLPPIRSLVSVGSGAAKLVTLPVKSYKKDRRLLKGMQRALRDDPCDNNAHERMHIINLAMQFAFPNMLMVLTCLLGTISFLRSISLEAIGLGVHLAAGAHEILLQAEYILTSIPPAMAWLPESRGNSDVRSNQPKDAIQGVKQAYESINDGLNKSASALVRTPLKNYQRGGGVGSTLATVLKAAPVAAVAPASATARAVHFALLGVRNSLDPERKKESLDKYLGATEHREFI